MLISKNNLFLKKKNIKFTLIKYFIWLFLNFFISKLDYYQLIWDATSFTFRINLNIQLNNLRFFSLVKITSLLFYFFKLNTLCQFSVLSDIIAVSLPMSLNNSLTSTKLENQIRFKVIYSLLSLIFNFRLSIVSYVKPFNYLEATTSSYLLYVLPSITKIYNNANWLEREVWDLFGISFFEHPDLRRILTDYGFEGHPLVKNFPLIGTIDTLYSDGEKKVIYTPISLTQAYRHFNFRSTWKA